MGGDICFLLIPSYSYFAVYVEANGCGNIFLKTSLLLYFTGSWVEDWSYSGVSICFVISINCSVYSFLEADLGHCFLPSINDRDGYSCRKDVHWVLKEGKR